MMGIISEVLTILASILREHHLIRTNCNQIINIHLYTFLKRVTHRRTSFPAHALYTRTFLSFVRSRLLPIPPGCTRMLPQVNEIMIDDGCFEYWTHECIPGSLQLFYANPRIPLHNDHNARLPHPACSDTVWWWART